MATTLTASQLGDFKARLREREAQLRSELGAGARRADAETFERIAGEAPDAGDISVADNAQDGLSAERERDTNELLEVQAALERIEAGTYGICMQCGEPIDPRRLEALPTARYDLEHEQAQERARGGVSTPKL